MNNHSTTSTIRREARPLTVDEMSEGQWLAVAGIIEHLRGLANLQWSPRATDPLSYIAGIDGARRNQVFMFEGSRGTGKTAAMVTLIDGFGRQARKVLTSTPPGPMPLFAEPAIDSNSHRRLSDDPTALIVPLRIVDVRPLPEGRAIPLILLGAFADIVEHLDCPQNLAAPPSLASAGSNLRDAYDKLEKAAAIGWAAEAPGASIGELLALEIELRRIDEHRRDLLPAFGRFMDALVTSFVAKHPGRTPLFLLSLDDLDMNPDRVDELLDLVRSLTHPRLAILLTGENSLLHLKGKHTFARELAPLRTNEYEALEKGHELAVAHVEKSIPSEHTFGIGLFDPDEAFAVFEAAVGDGVDAALLETVRASDIFRQGLPGVPRNIQAVAGRFAQAARRAEGSRVAPAELPRFAERLLVSIAWPMAVDAQTYGHIGWVSRLRGRISLDRHTLVVDAAMFVPSTRAAATLSLRHDSLGFGAALTLRREVIARGGSLLDALRARDPSTAPAFDPSTDILLPQQLAGLVRLAMSLLDDHSAGQTFAAQLADGPHVVVTHFDSPGGVLPLRWPTPRWRTIGQFERFADELQTRLQLIQEERDGVTFAAMRTSIARAFIASVATALDLRFDTSGASLYSVVASIDWGTGPNRDYALSGLLLLATPEAGLEAEAANEILRALERVASDAGRSLQDLQPHRGQWVGAALDQSGKSAGAYLQSVLQNFERPGFNWFGKVRPLPKEESALFEQVYSALHQVSPRFGILLADRARLFNPLEPAKRRALTAELQSLARGRRGDAGLRYLLDEAWKRSAPKVMHGEVRIEGGLLLVEPRMELHLESHAEKHAPLAPNHAVILTPIALRRRADVGLGPDDATLDFIYRLAWDSAPRSTSAFAEQHDVAGSGVGFPGLRIEDSGDVDSCWFAPTHGTLRFWEELVDEWNTLVADFDQTRSNEENQRFLDGLAIEWIQAFTRPEPRETYLQPNMSDDWDRRARQVVAETLSQKPRRGWDPWLLSEFASRAPGLSRQLRTVLFGALREHPEWKGRAAPAKRKKAAPAKKRKAAPAKRRKAAPAKKRKAAPAKKRKAAPAKKRKAAPAKKRKAAPAKKRKAAPAKKKGTSP